MKYMIYMSSAVRLLDEFELLEILTQSRANNTKRNVTGILLYGEGSFVQVLEGDENTLNDLFKTIEKDERHRSIIQIASGELEERNFPDWSMGFSTVNGSFLTEFDGFVHARNMAFMQNHRNHPALIVLKTFASTNRLS
jgi:hypothetical protein